MLTEIQLNLKEAMRSKDKLQLSTLRLLLAELEKEAILQLISLEDLTDKDILTVISRQIKKLDKEIISYLDVGRSVEKQEEEKKILQFYLPKQMTEEEVLLIVADIVPQVDSFKEAMSILKIKLNGKADMKFLAKTLKAAFDLKQ